MEYEVIYEFEIDRSYNRDSNKTSWKMRVIKVNERYALESYYEEGDEWSAFDEMFNDYKGIEQSKYSADNPFQVLVNYINDREKILHDFYYSKIDYSKKVHNIAKQLKEII